jgi:hypothetical protein
VLLPEPTGPSIAMISGFKFIDLRKGTKSIRQAE